MSVFVYNVWVIGLDHQRYWLTQYDSLELALAQEAKFRRTTSPTAYKSTLVTFTQKENANAEIRKEWGE
jgi:hypothetical protein